MKQLLLINNKYNLPPIPENIEPNEFKYRNKYRELYIKLMTFCKTKNWTEEELLFSEVHHILPKSLGGDNSDNNLVRLSIKYHIFAHLLLSEIYPSEYKLWYALMFMLNERPERFESSFQEKDRLKFIRLKESTKIKIEYLKSCGEIKNTKIKDMSGGKNPRARAVISPSGKKYSSLKDAAREEGIPYNTLTKWLSLTTTVSNHGWNYEKESDKQYPDRTGGANFFSKKIKNSKGDIFDSIIDASKSLDIPYTTLRYWLSGRTKDNHGWEYLN